MPLRSSWLSWTLVFAVGVSVALVGIEAWQIWQVRESTLRDAKFVTASLVQSVSQEVETTLKTADTVVGSLLGAGGSRRRESRIRTKPVSVDDLFG